MTSHALNVDEFLAEYKRKAEERAAKQAACDHEWVFLIRSLRNGWQYTEVRQCMHCDKTEVKHS